ncbi:hypothetical protein Q3A66_07835 [Hymenobacter sp. BT770]|uniref:hypothetical protein n=1 Tax=Hymenobacter sp. BT770 TaxID=2886942 RepID=UPI001D120F93|nr:hypothetical protein [Hymenobacter sp. BT770]MCC3152902.1 hypothetical protein [Hymenobacter sp. BT770]MDO3414977.1 hypothetical protein [Hymenobacter sp. BT770]
MEAERSPLAKFQVAYFGRVDHYLGWHDGYTADSDCLDALTSLERQQAEADLMDRLRKGTADPRAVLGLGHLRSEEALPLLHRCLRQSGFAIYALEAIAKINPAGLYQSDLAALLAPTTDAYVLINLLVGLQHYYTLGQLIPLVVHRIFALVAHPSDYLVRYHALHALRRLYQLRPSEQEQSIDRAVNVHDKVFKLITQKKAPGAYRKAQHLLQAEIAAISAY